MEFLSEFTLFGFPVLGYILPFLIVLTIVVFFHELGHYLVARWNGVDIEAFAVGFGPELIGFTDKHGTRWKFCAVPLGGYVKFLGDANAASKPDFEKLDQMSDEEKSGSYEHKSVGQRAAVAAAGPFANFILAIIIFAGSFYFVGRYVSDPVVSEVVENSAAAEAGFQRGDIIVKVDGSEVSSFSDIPRLVGPNHGIEMLITVERAGKLLDIPVTPKRTERTDRFGNVTYSGVIGIASKAEEANVRLKEYGALEAVGAGVGETYFIIKRTLQYLGAIVVGRESADQLGGPIRIAKVSGEVATLGFVALINLTAILSVSIGLLNLFPIPMLDGGHLVFYAIEAIKGKPLSENSQEIGFRIGMGLVLSLMVFATWNDITQIFLN